jgi:hypothetical protein
MNTAARLFHFLGGEVGPWRVIAQQAVVGAPLAPVEHVAVSPTPDPACGWVLRGITSNERYVERGEKEALVARQQSLGRPQSTRAALIPLRKSAAWWALTQDERREVFEARSRHIETGLRYLPAVARRLHHCRDLGPDEPFDFITWFEYAPVDEPEFDELLQALRATPEWAFVEREVDIRLAAL